MQSPMTVSEYGPLLKIISNLLTKEACLLPFANLHKIFYDMTYSTPIIKTSITLMAILANMIHLSCAIYAESTSGPYFASGAMVGEVTQDSAIIWTRLTAEEERNWDGLVPAPLMSPTRVVSISPDIPVWEWEGSVRGVSGEVRVAISELPEFGDSAMRTEWITVDSDTDYTHKFMIDELDGGTRYYYIVEGRLSHDGPINRSAVGTFGTAPNPAEWEDVWFSVIDCQLYYQRDDLEGFKVYESMARLSPIFLDYPDFMVRTGDNVYYDRDNPRGRTLELCRLHWQRMYSLPMLQEFLRQVPSYWQKDDHDAYFDDSHPALEAPWIAPLTYSDGARLFREQTPVGESLYRTVRWGKGLQVWFTESRDFRSPETDPDTPEKTIWGQEQKEWLKRTLLESDAPFKIIISPTAIVGPDNPDQADNHANPAYEREGNEFRQWAYENGLTENLFIIAGDRHWQYVSTDPKSGLREYVGGPASDKMVLNGPGYKPNYHSFYRLGGGFITVNFNKGTKKVLANPQRVVVEDGAPILTIRIHDVDGEILHEVRHVAAP
jgi:alkaline phosphatase D